jgi:hypothetical protein
MQPDSVIECVARISITTQGSGQDPEDFGRRVLLIDPARASVLAPLPSLDERGGNTLDTLLALW